MSSITITTQSFGAINSTVTGQAPATITLQIGTPGPRGEQGIQGVPGPTGPTGATGAGVPAGGTAGQFLYKVSGTDYDTDWNTINLSAYAPLNSPALTGVPTAPTAATGDLSTQIATTAFVQGAVIAGSAHAETLQAVVRNNTGSTLAPFTVVYINGALGNKATVAKAQANAEATSSGTYAVTETSIANNADGNVISAGVLSNVDTSAFVDGDKLYLSPSVAGGVTTTKPSAPNHLVYVGVVTRSHPTQGTVSVRIQNGYELEELHNVAIASVANNDLLAYESSTSLWKNKTYSALGLETSSHAAATYYPLSGNPSGFLTSSALTPYLTSATAASTYQTLSGMSSYAPLASPALTGTPTAPTALTADSSTTIATTAFVKAQGYLTSAPVTSVAGRTGAVTLSTTDISGISSYATLASPALTGTPTAPTALTADNSTTIATTAFVKAQGYLTSAPVTSVAGRTGAVTLAVADVSGAAPLASPTFTGTVTIPAGASISGYAPLAGSTFTGLVTTVASAAGTAGFNVPHGAAPTTPVNGDLWTTTGGLFARINGGTQQYAALGSTNTFTGTNTFSGSSLTLGSATGASTYGLGTGATIAAATQTINIGTGAAVSTATKAINIGTAGLAGSTTNIAIGSTTGTNAITINGPTTFVGTVTIPAGASISGFAPLASPTFTGTPLSTTAAVDTNTTQIATTAYVVGQGYLKSATASSTYAPLASPALTGTPTAPTAAASTNTTQVATTAFVVGQAATVAPLIDGTAAVGTSLLYARQDHVHPTDTTRAPIASPTFTGTVTIPAGASISGFAPLASPTFTGVPAAPTAAVDTNTTQVATTAYVVGQGYLKSATASSTYAPLASPTLTGVPAAPTAAVDTNTTQLATTAYVVGQGYLKSATASSTYAPLASPTLTGTPAAPTATAGTNTTQIATTAFVQSALPAFATEAQVVAGTSTTTAINPLQVRNMLANAGYTTYSSIVGNYSSFGSGSGAYGLTASSDYICPYVSGLSGKSGFVPSSAITNCFQSRGKVDVNLDWSKPMWFSFRFHFYTGSLGDATTICRATLGKTSSTFGDLASAGFGVKWTGGSSGAFTLMAHNGSALTTSASAVTVSNTTYFPTTLSAADFLVYSDGAGNITLFCNGTQVATTTGGPSSGTTTSARITLETDNSTTYTGLCAPTFTGLRSFFGY